MVVIITKVRLQEYGGGQIRMQKFRFKFWFYLNCKLSGNNKTYAFPQISVKT